jgi:hypothetical protein
MGVVPVASRIESKIPVRDVMSAAVYSILVAIVRRDQPHLPTRWPCDDLLMTRAIAGAGVLAAAVAACFATPTRPSNGDSGVTGDGKLLDGLSIDAMLNIDGNPNTCMIESFVGSGSGTCGTWADMTNLNGMASFSNTSSGELLLAMFGGTGTFVSCTSKQYAPWSRVTIDIQDVATNGPTNRTFVGLQSKDGLSRWGLDFADQTGTAVFTTSCDGVDGSVTMGPWNALKHRYIKVERTMPSKMTISTSQNNTAFEPLTECTTTADLTMTQAQLRAYTQSAGSGSSSTSPSDLAKFGFIELCQD